MPEHKMSENYDIKSLSPHSTSGVLTRRQWIFSAPLAAGFSAIAFSTAAAEAPADEAAKADPAQEFYALSAFLTRQINLDPQIAARAFNALQARDSGFLRKMRELQNVLNSSDLASVDELRSKFADPQDERFQTAVEIISAWYLGRVGEVSGNTTTSRPLFITYVGALMWKPTADVTVIPTYSRGGPGYWETPPATLAQD